MESVTAAVRCGAAAVYLGAENFNARRGAQNFTADGLREAVAYCHARGVKVHLTLNTLLRDDELEAAMDTAALACRLGIDAIIVQDPGLARLLKAAAPAMPLHASTQLSCHTPAGVALLRDAGFSRVVLAREMSREEIAACTRLGVETEVFVHGALCMSVSGQCYFSAMLGGRSGNRGACAQTCRLPFEPTGAQPRPCPPDRAALSLKDNCLAAYVGELADMGVTSLKIEGRMKRPEYVAAATAVYSAATRGEEIDPERFEQLKSVFSRTGFTDGYYIARRGGGMFGTRRKEDVTAAAGVLNTLAHTYDSEQPLIPVDMELTVGGDACALSVTGPDGNGVFVIAPPAEKAVNRPLESARAEEQLKKTGGTPFYAVNTVCNIEEGLTLPMAQINGMRRQALIQLLEQRAYTPPIPCDTSALPPAPAEKVSGIRGDWVRLADIVQWSPALRADGVFLPLTADETAIRRILDAGQAIGADIPRGMFGQEEAIRAALRRFSEAGATAALCGNIGAIPLAIEAGLLPVGGFSLNITNRETLAFFRERGLSAATLSFELTFPQIRALCADAPLPVGLMVYGHQPLMLTRNCPRSAALGGCRDCRHQGITDRTGTTFPVMCAGGCSEVLNSVPLYWGDRPDEIPAVDFRLFHVTVEDAARAAAVMNAYRDQAAPPAAITRGLYRRGVE